MERHDPQRGGQGRDVHLGALLPECTGSGGAQGQASDIEIQAREILVIRRRLNEIYCEHTGRTIEEIEQKLERDAYMSADEALSFGVVDDVVCRHKSTETK